MIRVAALTSGKNAPSARLRIRQHIEPLRGMGIHVREYMPFIDKYAPLPKLLPFPDSGRFSLCRALWKCAKIASTVPGVAGSRKGQITWLEREIHPGLLTLEPMLKRPYVLDVDDAIWLYPPLGRFALERTAKNAETVLAGNSYIAEWLSSHTRDVRIVPTAVDTERIIPRHPQSIRAMSRRFVVGWTGTSSNFSSLYQIEKPLERFLRNHDAEFIVIADQPPRFSELKPNGVRFIKWTPDIELKALGRMDVGLMPLISDEWGLGKCSFKMLQYMAAGLPVVVSPVGMNVEVLSMGDVGLPAVNQADWYEALSNLYHDPALAHRYGAKGRLIVEKHFSRNVISTILAGIFKEFS